MTLTATTLSLSHIQLCFPKRNFLVFKIWISSIVRSCLRKLPHSSFRAEAPIGKVFATCISCRSRHREANERKRQQKREEKKQQQRQKQEEKEQQKQVEREQRQKGKKEQQEQRKQLEMEEKKQREQQQQVERERQRAASIEQHQRMEEHQETLHGLSGPSRKRKRAAVPNPARHFNESTTRIPSCLEEEYPKFARATRDFPPSISPDNLRKRYNDYQQHVNWCADRSPCGICGGSFQSDSVKRYTFDDLNRRGNIHEFDLCAVRDSTVGVCSTCMKGGVSSKLKFSGENWVNTTLCQDMPAVLANLTIVEKNVIARSHLIGYIIRLSTTSKAGVSYRGARGHIIAFKQDPTLLLKILPSPEVEPHHNITVSWDGGAEPTDENLRKFCTVRRKKVLNALEWLKENNELYRDVKINYELLRTWPDDAVPPQLIRNAVRTEPGLSDHREGYSVDRETMHNNMQSNFLDPDGPDDVFENEMDQRACDADPGSIVTGAFLQDTEKENETWRERYASLFAELELTHRRAKGEANPPIPHIQYRTALGSKPINSWIDPTYFLGAFPDLFPYGTGGHYQPDKNIRMNAVSLEEFGRWAMTHHSHRFARHPIFPYVLYDMILLRQTAIGNSLQARKGYWERAQVDILAVSSEDLRAAALRMRDGEKCGNPAIDRLLNNMRLISSYNPESYGRKVAKRHLLFGHIVRYGIPAIWFTINPGDLRNPVILRVAGVYICPQLSRAELNNLRRIHAIGNPTIVAQYFHFVLDSFFKKLLCTDSGEVGILGEISNHFGVVESNSRHMLHLHGFLWVTGNMDFLKLQQRVLADEDFRNRLSTYMKATICEVVDEPAATQYRRANPDIDDFIDDPADPTDVFMDKMEDDSNYIASRCQIHNHTFTCFKYGQRKTAKGGEDGKSSSVTPQGCSPPFPLRKPTNS